MNKKELDFILQEGEGLKIEFKENFNKSLVKDVVAFANSYGGRIFLGVSDRGEIKGIKVTNKLKSQIQDLAKNCDPDVKINLETFDNVFIINVPEGDDKPHQCSSGFYLRQGANSQKLTRNEILDFSIGEGKIKFDEQTNKKFDFKKDFDGKKFKEYLRLAKIKPLLSIKNMLFNLGLYDRKNYNNACVLFFSKKLEKFFLSSKVICANYQGNEKAKILDKKVFDEGIIENINEAINYVKKHINVEYEIKTLKRKEILQFPEDAIRECIVNAVMHRDYFDNSGEIMIEVFRNKLIISNPGGLVKSLKPEMFGKVSRTRNSLVAGLLSRTEFVERMGTGISRIKRAMKKFGLPKPEFFYDGSFLVTLYDKSYVKKTVVKTVVKTVGKTVGKILALIEENPKITREELSVKIGLTIRGIEWNLAMLKKKGLLKRIGPKKGGYWEVVKKKKRVKK